MKITVFVPKGNGYTSPEAMQRVEEHLHQDHGAHFEKGGTNLPEQQSDETWIVYAQDDNWGMVQYMLEKQYGFIAVPA